MAKNKNYYYAVGRRKNASARVRLYKGKSESLINDEPISKYFPGEVARFFWSEPFDLTDTGEKYYITVKVAGGGKKGQLEAVVHGISRALAMANPAKFKLSLKKAGLLTRDARIRERRKVGTGGRARRQKQSPKR
ncbi:30S ribosomal protein S9 [Candidatus Woesebacteria bacterium]|nr:30S ribosomal protein S9 [Candidatus Woesebacteria bacterium]